MENFRQRNIRLILTALVTVWLAVTIVWAFATTFGRPDLVWRHALTGVASSILPLFT
jgi:hypothetical protein